MVCERLPSGTLSTRPLLLRFNCRLVYLFPAVVDTGSYRLPRAALFSLVRPLGILLQVLLFTAICLVLNKLTVTSHRRQVKKTMVKTKTPAEILSPARVCAVAIHLVAKTRRLFGGFPVIGPQWFLVFSAFLSTLPLVVSLPQTQCLSIVLLEWSTQDVDETEIHGLVKLCRVLVRGAI